MSWIKVRWVIVAGGLVVFVPTCVVALAILREMLTEGYGGGWLVMVAITLCGAGMGWYAGKLVMLVEDWVYDRWYRRQA